MSMYARGKLAFGFCDICGFRCDLADMQHLIYDQKDTNLLVCQECNDEDQPQLQLGKVPINDPQALYNPRPDIAQAESRRLFGFNPVGNPAIELVTSIGNVRVIT